LPKELRKTNIIITPRNEFAYLSKCRKSALLSMEMAQKRPKPPPSQEKII